LWVLEGKPKIFQDAFIIRIQANGLLQHNSQFVRLRFSGATRSAKPGSSKGSLVWSWLIMLRNDCWIFVLGTHVTGFQCGAATAKHESLLGPSQRTYQVAFLHSSCKRLGGTDWSAVSSQVTSSLPGTVFMSETKMSYWYPSSIGKPRNKIICKVITQFPWQDAPPQTANLRSSLPCPTLASLAFPTPRMARIHFGPMRLPSRNHVFRDFPSALTLTVTLKNSSWTCFAMPQKSRRNCNKLALAWTSFS